MCQIYKFSEGKQKTVIGLDYYYYLLQHCFKDIFSQAGERQFSGSECFAALAEVGGWVPSSHVTTYR